MLTTVMMKLIYNEDIMLLIYINIMHTHHNIDERWMSEQKNYKPG
jgi:hypothetical protein